MIIERILLLFTFLQVFITASSGQTTMKIPKEFVEAEPPKVGDNKWYSLNHSQNEFGVKIIDGKLDIKKITEKSKCELKISGGTLIGIDRGEWGGQLILKPDDTTKKTIDIKSGNIKFIFNYNGKIYFIEGLAHMGISEGAIFELDIISNKFNFTKLIDFDDAPEAFTIYKDKFLIATHENFYIVQDFKKELIFKKTFWCSLYPNSIVALDDKNVFVGIRSGIVKLDLTDRVVKFYKNDK
jgi:hypothetical protein